jgi:hypothetical protein
MLRGAVILCAMAPTFCAGQTYSVNAIPGPLATWSEINSSGQAVGSAVGGQQSQAIIGSAAGTSFIPFPDALSGMPSMGNAINDAGQVAGSVGSQAFVGNATGVTVIPLPGSFINGSATAINSSGQVAGWGANGGYYSYQAFIGDASSSTAIPLPNGWSVAFAAGINDSGVVAGYGMNGANQYQAWIGTASGVTAIPLPAGWTAAQGLAINNSGQVAGLGYNAGGKGRAFIGTASGSTPIPLPAGATNINAGDYGLGCYRCLNDSGSMVGLSDAGAWIWDPNNGTRLLTNLVPSGWNISTAISISDNGAILAIASNNDVGFQFVVLYPVAALVTLTWQNDQNGGVLAWYMGGSESTVLQSYATLGSSNVGWTLCAVADLDRNGFPDLIWQGVEGGQAVVWYLGGPQGGWFESFGTLSTSTVGWTLAAAADMNGDGVPDLIWQNNDNGGVLVWYMGGYEGAAFQSWATLSASTIGWRLAAAADMNGDGVPDLIWQGNNGGPAVVWYMGGSGGTVFESWALLNSSTAGWTLRAAADLNRDGVPDLLWQGDNGGPAEVWYMGGPGGSTFESWALLSSSTTGWTLIN